MIRWYCTCRVSKHCPTSVYTDFLPANSVLTTFKYAFNEYLLVIPKCHVTKTSYNKMSSYHNVLLPKCMLPLPKCPLQKRLDTEVITMPTCVG